MRLALLASVLLCCCGCAATGGRGEDPAPPPDDLSGSLSARYRARDVSGGGDDQDVLAVLALDLADAGALEERRGWTASLLARGAYDLDGGESGGGAFGSLADTRGGDLDARLYHAWAELDDVAGLESLRVGRQLSTETPEVAWFDGVSLATEARGAHALRAGLYGGVPVHAYESSPAGDGVGGVFLEARPWSDARLRLDYMRLEDERDARAFEDDLLGLDLWQTFGTELSVHASASRLEGRPRDVGLDATWLPDEDWVVRASAYRLSTPQEDRALEADPLFDTLRTYQPFDEGRLFVTRIVSEHLSVDLGGDVRRVREEQDIGDFNRDYERAYVTATLAGALPGGVDLALSYDDWNSDASSIAGFDAELSRTFGGDVEARVGTDVSLFEYDFFLDEERERVRTWYLRFVKRPDDGPRLELRYEYQEDDTDRYRDLMVVASWRF